jgi:superoxide dismutase, Fe-Mn family
MKKREFLKNSLILGVAASLNTWDVFANMPVAAPYTEFTLPALPYNFDALEPHFDKATMEIHHDKHHAAYVKNLNEAIKGTSFEKMTLEQILENVTEKDTKVRNNAGGHYNHSLFWQWLSPNGGEKPTGKLANDIQTIFGSLEKFQEAFSTAAKTVFGSGWVWLVKTKKGLEIISTPNQDSPLMKKLVKIQGKPILGLDVWEHAYYLKYQNKRADYITAFWKIINWKKIGEMY